MGWVVVVHLDYSVSSWHWFGQKPILMVKTSFKKLSGGWVGGWWWCTWIITSALGPGLVRSQLLGSKPALKSYGWVGGWVVVHLDYNVSSWPWFGQKLNVRYVKVWIGSRPGQGAWQFYMKFRHLWRISTCGGFRSDWSRKNRKLKFASLLKYFNEENGNFDLCNFNKMIFQDVHFLKQLLLSLVLCCRKLSVLAKKINLPKVLPMLYTCDFWTVLTNNE